MKIKIRIQFNFSFMWFGAYWRKIGDPLLGIDIYLCLVPMIPIIIEITGKRKSAGLVDAGLQSGTACRPDQVTMMERRELLKGSQG